MSSTDRQAIWDQCTQAEEARNEGRVEQGIAFEIQSCGKCGFYNRAPLKKVESMTEGEKAMYEIFVKIPGYKAEPVVRRMIPFKSDLSVWTYLCERCAKNPPPEWF